MISKSFIDDYYPYFKKSTNEKEITSNLVKKIVEKIFNQEEAKRETIMVGDIGCGTCDTLSKKKKQISLIICLNISLF